MATYKLSKRSINFLHKKYIHQKLNDLHKELECPNEFIYDFIKDIQYDWDPNSYKSKSEKLLKNQPKSKNLNYKD